MTNKHRDKLRPAAKATALALGPVRPRRQHMIQAQFMSLAGWQQFSFLQSITCLISAFLISLVIV